MHSPKQFSVQLDWRDLGEEIIRNYPYCIVTEEGI